MDKVITVFGFSQYRNVGIFDTIMLVFTTILSQRLQMADKNKHLNFLKVHIVALVLAEDLAVGLLRGALVVQLFVYVGCLRAARCCSGAARSAVAGS